MKILQTKCFLSSNNDDENVSTCKKKTPPSSDRGRINIIRNDVILPRKLFNVDPETKVNNKLKLVVANVEKISAFHKIANLVHVIENTVALPIFENNYNEGNDVFSDTNIVLLEPSDQELLAVINLVTNEVPISNTIPSTEFYENDADDPTLQSISDKKKSENRPEEN